MSKKRTYEKKKSNFVGQCKMFQIFSLQKCDRICFYIYNIKKVEYWTFKYSIWVFVVFLKSTFCGVSGVASGHPISAWQQYYLEYVKYDMCRFLTIVYIVVCRCRFFLSENRKTEKLVQYCHGKNKSRGGRENRINNILCTFLMFRCSDEIIWMLK